MANQVLSPKEVIEIYESGKHRRYSLLFSVNGGALAIGKLIVSGSKEEQLALGSLRVWMVGVAIAIFSSVMTYDIWQFGMRMRRNDPTLFGPAGQRVLIIIGVMLTAVGLIVAIPSGAHLP